MVTSLTKWRKTHLIAIALIVVTLTVRAAPDDPFPCPAAYNTARFCQSSVYVQGGKEQEVKNRLTPVQSLFYNLQEVREYKYEQEFFEGSISLTQIAVAWKQISTQSSDQIRVTDSNVKTSQVIRIKHFWQLPHVWSTGETKLNYDDLRKSALDPSINDFYEVIYTNPMSGSTYSSMTDHALYEWFIGDLVPMKSCAYIVNMNTKTNGAVIDKFYSFQRIMMSIQYDITNLNKIVKIVPDAAYIQKVTGQGTELDLMKTHIPINYYWRWSAFYWFTEGYLFIKQDSSYSASSDPCQRDTPIFNPTSSNLLTQHKLQLSTTAQQVITHAFVYEGLYFVLANERKKIYRLEGKPGVAGFTASVFFDQTDATKFKWNLYSSASNIVQIVSMEYYGLFVNVDGQKTFLEIEPHKLMVKNTNGTLKFLDSTAMTHDYGTNVLRYDKDALTDTTKTLGVRERTDLTTVCPTATQFKFSQTYGEMSMHRPVYLICNTDETTIYRVTTVINKFFEIKTGHPTRTKTQLWSFPLQTLRFHILNIQPGNTDTLPPASVTAPNLTNKAYTGNMQTFQSTEAVIIDLRHEDEVLRWPLTTCGDTIVNATYAFEECDYAKSVDTPIDLINPNTATMNTYNYPDIDADNQRTITTIVGNNVKLWSGKNTIWWDNTTKKYYNCNTLCKKVPITLCGDGIPSNGRVPNGSGGYKKDPTNQEVGTDLVVGDSGHEVCDDGTQRSGDGCSADCKTIEMGYECPRWGTACNLKCGNGRGQWETVTVNGVTTKQPAKYQRMSRMTGQTSTVIDSVEECDLGIHSTSNTDASSPGYKDIACNADCMITDKNLWRCTWVEDLDASSNTRGFHSKCEYLCGNKVVDRISATNGMTISETCDKGVQQWTGMEYSNGYKYPLKTGATSSNDFTGSISSPVLGTLITGDGSHTTLPYLNWLDPAGPHGSWIQWFSTEKTNIGWLVGCDAKCQVINKSNPDATLANSETIFTCPPEWVSNIACTDRCGDGIMDGYINFFDGGRSRATKPYPTGVNGYTPQNSAIGFDYAERMPVEECDPGTYNGDPTSLGYNPNGIGDPTGTHGCTNMCKIEPGWTCTHFFYKMLRRAAAVEEPLFRSECWKLSDTTQGPWRRRLMPEDFDPHGRYLNHLPQRYFNYLLPQTNHHFADDVLKLSPKIGLNGQMRLIEAPCSIASYGCTTTDAVVGIVYGFEASKFTDDDYVYITTRGKATPANDYSEKLIMSGNSNALKGKMRNTFGQYLVMNTNPTTIEIWGYKNLGSGSIKLIQMWTSAAETSIQYMGAHEFYWWPYNSFLMARLSDGSSFKFFRFAKNFQTIATQAEAAVPDSDKIQDNKFNLFHVNGRITVPPVFHEQFIYLYTTKDSVGTLSAYYYNSARMEMDLVCQENSITESSSLYQDYSLVKLGADGFIFHVPGQTDTKLYYCNSNQDVETRPASFTKTTVTFDFSTCSANPTTSTAPTTAPIYCGLASSATAGVKLKQARDDPETYVSGTIPPIWGWFTNEYFIKLAYSNNGSGGTGTAPKLKPSQSILLPKELNLVGRNDASNPKQGNLVSENMDVGNLFLAIMSPTQCQAQYKVSGITNPSVYYYNLANTSIHYDLINCDTNPTYFSTPDGLSDYDGCTAVMDTLVTPNVQKVTASGWKSFTGTAYDPLKGWTCVNLPVTEAGTQAWQLLV